MADTAQFWANQPGSARIEADSVRIKPVSANRAESTRIREGKKNSDAAPTRGQPRRTRVQHPPSHVRTF